ncbi:hypothetical protein MRX96_040552 [Rhipicephalus microplus]
MTSQDSSFSGNTRVMKKKTSGEAREARALAVGTTTTPDAGRQRLQVQPFVACADDQLELTEQEDVAWEHQENEQAQMMKPDVLKERDPQNFVEYLQNTDGMEDGAPSKL